MHHAELYLCLREDGFLSAKLNKTAFLGCKTFIHRFDSDRRLFPFNNFAPI
jgi:hypothetical protein